jgi:Tfp pilus assembly protein PilN
VSTATVTRIGQLPRVNLLPPEILEGRRFRQVQYGLGGALLVALAIVALLYSMAAGSQGRAQQKVDKAKATNVSLQRDLSRYDSVKAVYTQVATREGMLTQAAGSEVQWSQYLNDLSLSVPDNVWITAFTATQTPPAAAAKPAAGAAAADPGIGTVTFTGTAFAHDDVATWLESLAKVKGYTNSYVTTSTKSLIGSREVVNYTSSVTVTKEAYSGRYAKPAGN